MPRSNPFFRRASTPGDILSDNHKKQLSVSTPSLIGHSTESAEPSLTDSTLKVPSLSTEILYNTQPHGTSIRPSRFVKAAIPIASVSSPIMSTNSTSFKNITLSTEMNAFVQLFDTFTHKIYMEGYLMKYNNSHDNNHIRKKKRTKIFAEVSGSKITLWDTELAGSTILPTYFHITDNVIVHSEPFVDNATNKQKHVFTVRNSRMSATFETSDEALMLRWICAIRLCCFEKQKLDQLFTYRLLSSYTFISTVEVRQGVFLQVRLPNSNIWQKYWAILNESSVDTRKTKRFGRKASYESKSCQKNISLLETKKSKAPVHTFSNVSHAYAIYPESPQLIEKGSMIRIIGILDKNQNPAECWFMAVDKETTIKWLLAIYDLFGLYGRPDCLLNSSDHPKSLNFGNFSQENNTQNTLFLETNDVIDIMTAAPTSSDRVESAFMEMITIKLNRQEEGPSKSPMTGANCLPLIASEASSKSNKCEEKHLEGQLNASFQFTRNIADSSDESSEGEDEDEGENEQESDDDQIEESLSSHLQSFNKEGSALPLKSKKSPVNELIPNFDFGNGFDVPKSVTAVAANISASQTLPTRGSRQQGSRHRSSMAIFMDSSSYFEKDSRDYLARRERKLSTYIQSKASKDETPGLSHSIISSSSASSSCTPSNHIIPSEHSVFNVSSSGIGGTDGNFSKFLDEPSDYHRKFSLTFSSTELNSSSVSSGSYFNEYKDLEDHEATQKSSQYSDIGDRISCHKMSGPMIPSLGDHFAPQNSLLDTYLGDQLSAKEQIEYAKATGQPLIQVSIKKEIGSPKGGLVGVISQREKDRKEGTGYRVAERVNQHHTQQDLFEREKEKRLLEQRQQQYMKHQMLLYANGLNLAPMPMMNNQNYRNPQTLPNGVMPLNMTIMQQQQYNHSLPLNPYAVSSACIQNNYSTLANRSMASRPFYGPSPMPCSPLGYFGGPFVPNSNFSTPLYSQGHKPPQSTLYDVEGLPPGQKNSVNLKAAAVSAHAS